MKHNAKVLGLPAIMMMLTLAFPICLANSSAIAAQPLLTSIIPIQGKQYVVEILGFTDCDAPGTPTKIFYTHEMAADKACLYAKLVELQDGP